MQPEIRLPDRVGTHFLTAALVVAVLVGDGAISDGVGDVYPLLRHLAGQRLRQLPHRRPPGAVGREMGGAAQRTERTGEDQSAFLRAARGERSVAVVGEEALDGFLREGECPANVRFQRIGEVLGG